MPSRLNVLHFSQSNTVNRLSFVLILSSSENDLRISTVRQCITTDASDVVEINYRVDPNLDPINGVNVLKNRRLPVPGDCFFGVGIVCVGVWGERGGDFPVSKILFVKIINSPEFSKFKIITIDGRARLGLRTMGTLRVLFIQSGWRSWMMLTLGFSTGCDSV